MTRIRGDKNQFWNAAAVGVGGKSAVVDIGRSTDQITIFATVSGATTLSVEIAHMGDITSEGILPEEDDSIWFPLSYVNSGTNTSLVFAGAGNGAWIIPDIAFMHCRLSSSAAATITAGWQAVGD
jgi:hypothetical protein